MKRILFVLILLSFYSHPSWGWGKVGHQTSALIGEAYLMPQTQAAIREILDGQRLIDVATWADNVRDLPEFKHTAPYHYQNVRSIPGKVTISNIYLHKPSALMAQAKSSSPAGVVEAITAAQKVLANPSAPKKEKQLALKFLVHFIGDLHQPLHTGKAELVGGNGIDLQWNGRKTNLHKVWDTDLISDRLSEISDGSQKYPCLVYAQWLIDTYPDISKAKAETNDIGKWYQESLDVQTKAYDQTYLTNPTSYAAEANPTIDVRVLLAGKRMGQLLNELLGKSQIPTVGKQMIQTAEKIFGTLENVISFQPRSEKQKQVRSVASDQPQRVVVRD